MPLNQVWMGSIFLALIVAACVSTTVNAACPDYAAYAQKPHGTKSSGSLGLPYMRPDPVCRTFSSPAVEKVIDDMKARLKDPDLARLFENTFPNTLDTTVKYYSSTENLAFIITGDITAQWLRDTANQFAAYYSLLSLDKGLAKLVKAVINNEARYVSQFPYCGSFQPPPESGLPTTDNPAANGIKVNPPIDSNVVFECKYEIDSLCGFLKLSRSYYAETKDASIFDDNWNSAIKQIFRVINEQSQSTFDDNFNFISHFSWSGAQNSGTGEPKEYTGMVGTLHRPSDDQTVFPFHTAANAMLSVELKHIADVLDQAQLSKDLSQLAREWSSRIHDAIWNTTVSSGLFSYETNVVI